MSEKIPAGPGPEQGKPERKEPTQEEIRQETVKKAIDTLSQAAFTRYLDIFQPAGTAQTEREFKNAIAHFNALSPIMRGQRSNSHVQTTGDHREASVVQENMAGHKLVVTIEEDGTIELSAG